MWLNDAEFKAENIVRYIWPKTYWATKPALTSSQQTIMTSAMWLSGKFESSYDLGD
jgi:hypothetical protein